MDNVFKEECKLYYPKVYTKEDLQSFVNARLLSNEEMQEIIEAAATD